MDDRTITLLLRLIHILAGVFWVGAMFVVAGFLLPALRRTGRQGGEFMRHIMQDRRLGLFLGLAMGLTILSGLTMYARTVSATNGAWASTAPGIAYGFGGLAAVLAALVGGIIGGFAGRRLAAVGGRARKAGAPSAEMQAEIERLQGRVVLGARLAAALLAIAAAAMATARYL